MKHLLSSQQLEKVSDIIAKSLGLFFPKEKWSDLERGLQDSARDFNFSNPVQFIDWLTKTNLSQTEVEVLASHFTIGETYFFRDKTYFSILESELLPKLIQERRRFSKFLRIWSAGCSSGEEAYSLAILLLKLIPDWHEWNITILASDINMKSQSKMKKGVYSEWSFRNTDPELKKNYFKKTDNRYYKLNTKVKQMVTPVYLNLISDPFPSLLNNTNAMDIIFCRNVLMYFVPDKISAIVRKFSQSLINEGCLFVGGSEYHLIQDDHLKLIQKHGVGYFQKTLTTASAATSIMEDPLITEDFESSDLFILDLDPLTVVEEVVDDPSASASASIANIMETESLARNLANQGALNEALLLLEKAIPKDKCNKNLYYLKALILLELNKIPESIQELRKSIYLDPEFVLPYFTLGNVSRQCGKMNDAKKAFEVVISLIKNYEPDQILPGSEGITANRMKEIVELLKG